MKRCPQCNRVEADDALVFCRTDGTALVAQEAGAGSRRQTAGDVHAPLGSEAGRAQLGSVDAGEVHTSILPHNTGAAFPRVTGPTTSLPATSLPVQQSTGAHQHLTITRRPKPVVIVVAAILLIGIVVAAYSLGGRFIAPESERAIESVAVLPFENKSATADSEYLSDGLAESLIYRLSQLSNLKVSPRSSVFRYKGKEIDAEKIGNELGVDIRVLFGSGSQKLSSFFQMPR